jgi:hypothetical protein
MTRLRQAETAAQVGGQAGRDAPVAPAEVQQSLRRVSGTGVTITKVHVATRDGATFILTSIAGLR